MADGEENSASPAGTPTAAEPPKKGMSAFLDVFRRADKNDDGKLSWYEFKTYFDDGSLSETELGELFHRIDTHNTNNIDVGELCDYFSQQLGPFEQVYSALEDLNSSINTALMSTAQDYPSMPQEGQFMRRFLLKEVLNQMESQQRSVDVASEHLEQESGSQDPVDANVEEEPQLSRARRRDIRRQMSGLSRLESHEDNSAALTQQVSRLKTLLDTLQSKVRLQPIEEELDMEDGASLVQVVQRRMEMEEDKEEEFRKALREYLEAVEGTDGCINLCVCRTPDREHIILYEIWAGTEAWKSHVSSSVSKTFQHKVIDLLAQPEQMSTISIPASWLQTDAE
ncbi:N-terminal EF-hand calcium-binding protein 1-like isoform X5 [Branchiostoma floridae]|uniref:N-terminal EF-hand calcium-binding protein 1-like isoform X1 n=1 Tax=Branchiostoma floridae TaxID=7739 RepID=A0A9J7M2S8_BRAFL|nr:N-terminal EF-hand calcium-binding protein 1-like isoform X1 [Branchiostoma floridae]XP_035693685.1 N-terminal EF-hand calcium-binding protein 1-like isoform X2 [Branchiostoma floridae]XP_035693686.1 N-terminal EF-hand calcium-binding protein 1-like isoform X3 [Branchiostoma floridae]XP_035693687.1 N-terminal EF-hand calcium-binding protein 1-like isoform X4 [Branchiostoma floridae]XP_035693688.1 N-terminal EF-hand calcium-binding protein 1-like isoform X5 [Branchiostoma floridae]